MTNGLRFIDRLIFVALLLWSWTARGEFTLPTENFAGADSLHELSPARFDALLDESNKLITGPDGKGSLFSVDAWIDATPPSPKQQQLLDAYRKQFDAPVAMQFQTLKHDPQTTIEEFYLWAHRRRYCPSAYAAFAEAADRAIHGGDLQTAGTLYHLAMRGGWIPDDARSARLKAIDAWMNATTKPWLLPSQAGASRWAAVVDNSQIFLSGPDGITALDHEGTVRWTRAELAVRSALEHPTDHGTDHWQPAFLADVSAHVQLLVTRQRTPKVDPALNRYILCAWRASDGKPLWSSSAQPLLADLSFVGAPAIAGRSTYSLALAAPLGTARATLCLVELDTLDGHPRWQVTLGSMVRTEATTRPWDSLWSRGEPVCDGDAVYVTPGCGEVACVDRFDGKIRWLHSYSSDDAGSSRWRGVPVVCSNFLVAAPQDSAETMAFDAATGKSQWTVAQPACLVGSTPTTALLADGKSVLAIRGENGKTIWKWDGRITAPATVKNQFILIPTAGDDKTIDVTDGHTVTDPSPRHFNLNTDAVRQAMESIGLR